MRCATVNQTRELLSANAHFQLQKFMQFCFCLHRTAIHLLYCCMATRMFASYCKCSVAYICNERCTTRCGNNFHLSLAVIRVYSNTNIFYCVWIGFELLCCLSSLNCNVLYEYMCCAIYRVLHAAAGPTNAQSCFVQHATCEFAFSHDFECTSALCKFFKFYFVLFVPLLFALHFIVHAAFSLLFDKAGVLRNCKFCSCNKANVFADAKCKYSPGTPTYLVILHFLAWQSGLVPLRTVHSIMLLAAP